MTTAATQIDFSKMNEEEAEVLVLNHIKGTRYERYLSAVEDFKQQFPDFFLKEPTHPIFDYELNDLPVDQLELGFFYLEQKVLNIDNKSWETRFFDALKIPSEQRTARISTNSMWDQQSVEIESFGDENQCSTLDALKQKNFVQEFVDEFNKNSKHNFGTLKNSNSNL
ncbi:hypothetical protein CANINC_003081 [Pichia inconspicua]|uniref:Uncharacterized protein n=1 Tax=Pichia inconspicua TaxID=52247 RepID=A0A4T0WZI9_9ASCO|nr:hypothetical protein CANINC_003081 [[Candida] inconspicua]